MNSHDTVNQYLRHFSEFIGAPLLKLNEQGVCAFSYQGRWQVVLELPEAATQLYFYAPLTEVPLEGRLAMYEQALKFNAYCVKTHGATLALDPDPPRLLLCYVLPIEALNEVIFTNALNNFVQTLQELYEQLKIQPDGEPNLLNNPDLQYWNQRV